MSESIAYDVLRAVDSEEWHAIRSGSRTALCGARPTEGWAQVSTSAAAANQPRVTCPRCAARMSGLIRR